MCICLCFTLCCRGTDLIIKHYIKTCQQYLSIIQLIPSVCSYVYVSWHKTVSVMWIRFRKSVRKGENYEDKGEDKSQQRRKTDRVEKHRICMGWKGRGDRSDGQEPRAPLSSLVVISRLKRALIFVQQQLTFLQQQFRVYKWQLPSL